MPPPEWPGIRPATRRSAHLRLAGGRPAKPAAGTRIPMTRIRPPAIGPARNPELRSDGRNPKRPILGFLLTLEDLGPRNFICVICLARRRNRSIHSSLERHIPPPGRPAKSPAQVGRSVGVEEVFGMQERDVDEDGALGWQERALCAQTDPEAFFPEKGGSTREAKKVSLSCDVRGECLEDAVAQDERVGIWGGLSEREGRKLKKRAV